MPGRRRRRAARRSSSGAWAGWRRRGPRCASLATLRGWQDSRARRAVEAAAMSGLGRDCGSTAAALATGGAFSILFTGETYDGADGGFGALSVVIDHSRGQGLLAHAPRRGRGGAGRLGWQVAVRASPPRHGRLHDGRGVRVPPISSRSRGGGSSSGSWGATSTRRRTSCTSSPYPTTSPPASSSCSCPVVMILVAFATSATLYEESPVISMAVLGLTIGVLSTISFEDGAGPLLRRFPGLRRGPPSLPGAGRTGRPWPPRGRGRD